MNLIKNKLKTNFTKIPNSLFKEKNLPDRCISIYALLASKSDVWKFNTKQLSKTIGVHPETFIKYRNILCERGWLVVENQKIRNSKFTRKVYHICSPPDNINYKNTESKTTIEQNYEKQNKKGIEKNGDRKNPSLNKKDNKQEKERNNINKKNINKTKYSFLQNPNPRQI